MLYFQIGTVISLIEEITVLAQRDHSLGKPGMVFIKPAS